MIGGMRKFAKSKWALLVLFIPLVIALAISLPDNFGGGLSGGTLSRIGGREISVRDVERDLQSALDRIRREEGRVVTPSESVSQGIPQGVYQELEIQNILLAYADKVGIQASADSLKPYLERNNLMVNEFGRLTRDSIIRAASQRQQTPREFEEFLRDYLTQEYIRSAAGSALTVPDILSQPWVNYLGESRTIRFAQINAATIPAPAEPTDAEMQAWYDKNKAAFEQPERRRISILSYTPDDFLDRVELTDAQVRAEYDKRIKEYSTPETRVVVEYTSTDRNLVQSFIDLTAQGIAVEQALAQAPGLQPVESALKPEDVENEEYRDFLFSLPIGKVHSVPVRLEEGDPWKAIMIKSTTPGVPTPFEEIAEKVRRDVAWPDAITMYEASAENFLDAAGGQPLEDIAKQFGFPVVTLAPIDAQARTAQGDQAQIMTQNVDALRQLFTLNAGDMTNVMEGDNVRSMFRLDEIIPPVTPPFADVKDRVKRGMMQERAVAAAKAAADAMAAAVKSGTAFEKAAADAKMTALPALTVARAANPPIDPAVVSAAFNLKLGETGVVSGRDGAPWVARIDKIEPVTPEVGMALRAQLNSDVTQSLLRDLNEVFVLGLRSEIEYKRDDVALQAYFEGLRGDQPQQ
jgi:peptidyl-prolyl cis-trans isomerase D